MEGGSYHLLRTRLFDLARSLAERAEGLNARRRALFGGQELSVLGNERARTEHNCVPRDIRAVGSHLLLGYNVVLGLKKETAVSDVFQLLELTKTDVGFEFQPRPIDACGGFLCDRRFVKDFQELFHFYKDTRFVQLRSTTTRLLMVFQTGASERDVRVLRFALDGEGRATYVDNRGEEELKPPPQHDFEWTRATRERFVHGRHPHVNVLDEVFVETVGGDLTIKVENNTSDGKGIYSEPVEDPDQSLDDAEFYYAKVGVLVLLKILPYREASYRYLVFNTRTKSVVRIDLIGQACVQLPEDQGIAFPGGYYLQTGDYKQFDQDTQGLGFKRASRSPNGEDVLYVFYRRTDGLYLLLPYNLVRREVSNLIACHGYSLLADGRMITFRSTSNDPARIHPMQIWQTPFCSPEHAAAQPKDGSQLSKIGNADLVRCISESLTLARLAQQEKPTRKAFEDVVRSATRLTDGYPWLGHPEVALAPQVAEVRKSADQIIDEFEKVLALEGRAKDLLAQAEANQQVILGGLVPESISSAEDFMAALTKLREQRGRLAGLREVRFVDRQRIEALDQAVSAAFEVVSRACVGHLARPDALAPLLERIARAQHGVAALTRTADLGTVEEQVAGAVAGLELLGETLGNLNVGEADVRATILERIGEAFALANRARAEVRAKRKELVGKEQRAEFGASFKLLSQAIESGLSVADTPDKCDAQLARLTVQLEELEGRFSELDELVGTLVQKREELFEAFAGRKQALLDERGKRAAHLFDAGQRVLAGISRRAESFDSEESLNAYFATDGLVLKIDGLAEQLRALGDGVRADELSSRLKQAKQEALRALRDKRELFENGPGIVRLGKSRFTVHTQPLELTILPKEGRLWLHLLGTDYREPLNDPALAPFADFWADAFVSEDASVARAEFLAYCVWQDVEPGRLRAAKVEQDGLLAIVRAYAAERIDEGYERGVHDVDAALLLSKVLDLAEGAALLRYPPGARVLALLYWTALSDDGLKQQLRVRARALDRLRKAHPDTGAMADLARALAQRIATFLGESGATLNFLGLADGAAELAGSYLAEELCREEERFTLSSDAERLVGRVRPLFAGELRGLPMPEGLALALAWVDATVAKEKLPDGNSLRLEAALAALLNGKVSWSVSSVPLMAQLEGLLSAHPNFPRGGMGCVSMTSVSASRAFEPCGCRATAITDRCCSRPWSARARDCDWASSRPRCCRPSFAIG